MLYIHSGIIFIKKIYLFALKLFKIDKIRKGAIKFQIIIPNKTIINTFNI